MLFLILDIEIRIIIDTFGSMEIPKKIKQVRKGKGISQKDMADKLNISISSYQKIEQGVMVLSITRFLEICQLLEIDSYKVLLPEVNAKHVEEVQMYLLNGSSAFKEIRNNAKYSLKLTNDLLEKIKNKEIDLEQTEEEIHFLNNYIEIIARLSSLQDRNLKSVFDLVEKLD